MLKLLLINTKHCGTRIPSGHYTMIGRTQIFFDVVSKQNITLNKWQKGEPNYYGGNEDCVELKDIGSSSITNVKWGMNDISCDGSWCPLCEMSESQQLHLRGSCPEENVDTIYYIAAKRNVTMKSEIIGYRQTKII